MDWSPLDLINDQIIGKVHLKDSIPDESFAVEYSVVRFLGSRSIWSVKEAFLDI